MASRNLVIVGAGPGLGLGIGRHFGRAGFRVALVARNPDRLAGLIRTLTDEGVEAEAFPADVTDGNGLTRAFAAIHERFGAVDVLEFSAMPPPADGVGRTSIGATIEVVEAQLRLTVLGAIASVRQVLPAMIARDSGTILITTGLSASVPIPVIGAIGVAMAAARSYTLGLNAALAGTGVFAATVSLGVFITPGDPVSDPLKLAETYYDLYQKRDRAEVIVSGPPPKRLEGGFSH